MTGKKSGLPASVAARLLNRAKQTGDDYQTLRSALLREFCSYADSELKAHDKSLRWQEFIDWAQRNSAYLSWCGRAGSLVPFFITVLARRTARR
jgi:hypothetical protein